MQLFLRLLSFVAFSVVAVPLTASAQYFFDQGLQTAVVRTDYDASDQGTTINPITLTSSPLFSCPDNSGVDSPAICVDPYLPFSYDDYAPTIYSHAYPWSFNGGSTASEFWVLSLNNEVWNKHDPSNGNALNPGAPNLSLPRAEPGLGIMGFIPIIDAPNEDFYRFHLVLNQMNWFDPNPQGGSALPFMSIGAASNRGNGGVLGYMNFQWAPSTVEWTSKVWDIYEANQDEYWVAVHFLITTAQWEGKTRMIQVALYHESDLNGAELHFSDPASGNYGQHQHWNWQVQESFWYPGADVVFMDAEDMYTLCGFSMSRLRNKYDSANYSVVLDDLYRCASDLELFDTPMPQSGAVPITGVHWANEMMGLDIALWTSVHNMKMRSWPSSLQTEFVESNDQPVSAVSNTVSDEISIIAERLSSSCQMSKVCWQENQQYINGKLRDRPENPKIFIGTWQDLIATSNDPN